MDSLIVLAHQLLILVCLCALNGILASIAVRLWGRVFSRVRYYLIDAYWMLAWLSWKGWHRVHGVNAKEFLEVAIREEHERKAARKEPK